MNKNDYSDIIDLPHHVSTRRKQMSIESRSAQFAPFAALTGYGDTIKEKARLTNERIELDDESKLGINNVLLKIMDDIKSRPSITITYFVPDLQKQGGSYETITDNVKRIDEVNKYIYLLSKKININDIIDININ